MRKSDHTTCSTSGKRWRVVTTVTTLRPIFSLRDLIDYDGEKPTFSYSSDYTKKKGK